MNRVLIYATATQGEQEAAAYEEAINYCKEGNIVFFVHCDSMIKGCLEENPCFRDVRCKICTLFQKSRARKYLPKAVNYRSISSFMDAQTMNIVNMTRIHYDNLKELRALRYKSVNIGYGALSTFISLTRNMEPELDRNVRQFIDKLLRQQMILTELLLNAVDEIKPDLIIFHNGRLAQYRPLLDIAESKKIDFISTEAFEDKDNRPQKNYFKNTIPHNALANALKYESYWESYKNADKIEIGKSFFENRRHGKPAGDKIYTKLMVEGELPTNWELNKKHIVIFNSSEDEFCAINNEVDQAALFPSQVVGIRKIVDFCQKNPDYQVYLRIHPNLMGIPYSYHTDLYNIMASNFTIIPPESKVSSYTLLDAADLIIVFGSTIGIEAAYWGKPVICLGYAFYAKLDVVYVPKTEEELWKMIESLKLEPKDNSNCLKFGLFYMSNKHEHFDNLALKWVGYNIFGHQSKELSYLTLMGSPFLYRFFKRNILDKFFCFKLK